MPSRSYCAARSVRQVTIEVNARSAIVGADDHARRDQRAIGDVAGVERSPDRSAILRSAFLLSRPKMS